MDFKALGLSDKTIQAINEAGIIEPTTVQADVIPTILQGKDVFTIAPAQCGKTCSYVFPLIDIISRRSARNILIITAGSQQSVAVSDRFAVFNKYHEITKSAVTESEEQIDEEANVIIASPSLLSDLLDEDKIDLSQVDVLVVDDINLIKKTHQLEQLEKVLTILPEDKQNIVYTNRRSKETQALLDKILQTPQEVKVNKDKEQEVAVDETMPAAPVTEKKSAPKTESMEELETKEKVAAPEALKKAHLEKRQSHENDKQQAQGKTVKEQTEKKRETTRALPRRESSKDAEALNLVKKYHTFGRNTPAFLLTATELAEDNQ